MSTIAIGAVAVVSVAIAGILFAHRPKKRAYVTSGIDHNQQSVVLPGAERIHRSPAAKDKFISYAYPDATTLYEALLRGIKQTPNGSGNFLGTRAGDGPYTWQSYAEVHQRALNLGAGLLSLGVKPGQSTYVGIYSQNRAEWIISEHACNAYSMITVPLYDTLGAEAVEFIVNQAGVSVILCDEPKIKGLFSLISSKKLSPVKIIVKFSQVTEAEAEEAAKLGVQLISIVAAEKKGQASPVAPIPPKPSDIATICYTSGTTGDPKGAMLTHGNLIADCGGVMYLVRQSNLPDPLIGPDDIHVSYLPLAHMFERIVAVWLTQSGGQIGFFRGDIKLLMSDIGTLRPTIFCSVPRLLNRVYDRVSAGVKASSGLKQALFNYGLKSKEAELEAGIIRNDSIWDKIIFKKVQATLGGRVKFVVTGSAPISKTCLQFLRCVLGCPIIEGYGQTECSAAGTISLLGDTMSAGTVGAVIPCGEIKLATVPDSKYLAENDEGEVCFRGPHVFKGYLNNPERTAEALDADGWLHSGDIGKWDEKGRLRIIDRKKAIFKLSQGEYIAPEKIENIYVRATSVAQVFVYGDSLQSVLVAIVVPDIEVMPTWLPKNVPDLSPNASLSDICKDPRVNALILKEMLAEGAQAKLASFEQVKAIHLSSTPFTVENNQLTPTFKSKRPQLTEAYRSVVDQLYQKIDQTQASSAN